MSVCVCVCVRKYGCASKVASILNRLKDASATYMVCIKYTDACVILVIFALTQYIVSSVVFLCYMFYCNRLCLWRYF